MTASCRFLPLMRTISRLSALLLVVTFATATPALALRVSTAYWKSPQAKILFYWIDTRSFPDAAQMEFLRTNLVMAMNDWEGICRECGIRFVEVFDRTAATFPVIGINTQGAFMANGFNPSDPKSKWELQIDRSYFNASSRYDKVGVLRHELGHILGYRHEQIAAPSDRFVTCGWRTERNTSENSVIALTDYDPASLMHYSCGVQAGKVLFEFSPMDIEGHRRLYGSKDSEQTSTDADVIEDRVSGIPESVPVGEPQP